MTMIKICIAVLTTATRASTLDKCLHSLSNMQHPILGKLVILVVQNREASSSEVNEAINLMPSSDEISFDTILETKLGIPMARNKALEYAIDNGFSHLGFIDDDAEPDEQWLSRMVNTLQANDVHAVAGPQVPLFPEGTDGFYKYAKVYKERELKDKSLCSWAASNNVIFDINFAKKHGLKFSEDMSTGGSDKEYFQRYSKCGGHIIWVKDALVSEYVEPARINFKWAIKRTFRFGGTGYRIERSTKSPLLAAFVCFAKGGIYIAKGFVNLVFLPFRAKRSCIDGFCDISHGIAFIMGVFSQGKLKNYT